MPPLKLKSQCTKANRLADDSISLTFVTAEEITTELFTRIDSYRKQHGWLVFKANEISDSEIPVENAIIEGGKSPSQHLRSCLIAKAKHKGIPREEWNSYYEKAMNGFAQAVINSFD